MVTTSSLCRGDGACRVDDGGSVGSKSSSSSSEEEEISMKTVDGGGGGSGGDDFLLLFLADICCSSLWRFVVWYTNRTARFCVDFEFLGRCFLNVLL